MLILYVYGCFSTQKFHLKKKFTIRSQVKVMNIKHKQGKTP